MPPMKRATIAAILVVIVPVGAVVGLWLSGSRMPAWGWVVAILLVALASSSGALLALSRISKRIKDGDED